MNKRNVITLTIERLNDFHYEYIAIDDNGNVLATRTDTKATNGKQYIAALVTKNLNHKFPYSVYRLFTEFDRMKYARVEIRNKDKPRKPFAIAVLEEHKGAYREWLTNQTITPKIKIIDLD